MRRRRSSKTAGRQSHNMLPIAAINGSTSSEQVRWRPILAGLALGSLLWLAGAEGYQLANQLVANNAPPKFAGGPAGQASEFVVRVKEGAQSIGRLIYTLRGEDPDDDPLTFGVLGSTASELLRVENQVGANQANVYLRKELDRETTESYQVVITLTDGKLGRGNWITKSMLIIVEDVNDNPPVFNPHRTSISVREDSQVPQVLETLEASDQDEGRFGQVIYKLEQQEPNGPFAIETLEGKGVLSLVRPLDYEQKALHQLRVVAVDRAVEGERLSASTSLLISVEDCDDQPPLFTFVPSITRIPEDLPVGAPVARLAASDGDRGLNQPIQYKLVAVNGHESGPDRNLFSISPHSGQISVAQPLDREAPSGGQQQQQQQQQPGSYVLQVSATELGSSSPERTVATELTVLLTDVNDEPPSFSQPAYFAEILENSPPESLVSFVAGPTGGGGQPRVVDRDQGTNGSFSLQLRGPESHLFEVWPSEATNEASPVVKVRSEAAGKLDYELKRSFQLELVATEKLAGGRDGQARWSSAQVSVQLRDANDNYPQFEQDLYRAEVPENAIKGMLVCTVRALDPDSGAYGSQGVRYTELRGEKAAHFRLDPVTGAVTLRSSEHGLDREAAGQHQLIVEARDANGQGNRNTSQLVIVVGDANDERPRFLLDQYEASIYENEPDFQTPLQVQASDGDLAGSANARLTYAIVAGDPQQNFTIDPSSGRIRVRQPLGPPPEPPDGPEGAESPSPTTVGPVGLDFEQIGQLRDEPRLFNLTVRATDAGTPHQLSGQTQVLVRVYDRNDHAPVFARPLYLKSVREDAPEGSQLVQVAALDGDQSVAHSRVSYRIAEGAGDKFSIDADSGWISVAAGASLDIDRAGQRRAHYLLRVLALDGQLSGATLVNITVLDVNNKPPEFVAPASQVQVAEDAPYGLVVARLLAHDLDAGAELRYSIEWALSEARNEELALLDVGQVRDLFVLDARDGHLRVNRPLDRELCDHLRLRLQVEDIAAETGGQVAHTHLLIRITDVNDNRPAFKRPLYRALVTENAPAGTPIIALSADDRDLNKTLRYSLEGVPEMLRLVRINPRSGELLVNDKIDRELHPLLNLTVRAEDFGPPHSLSGTAQLLISVRDENDNNPAFLNASQLFPHERARQLLSEQPARNHQADLRHRSLGAPNPELEPEGAERLPFLGPGGSVRVREDAPLGHQVAYVRAEDADLGNNGRVTYLLDAASSGGKFRIERDSGVISVAGPLDREQARSHLLIVEACDNYDLGHSTGESRRAFTQVSIQVGDVNDNVPLISTNLQLPASQVRPASLGPSYDEIMSSPGPYELPLPDCLFITEFQPINEPILTLTASDADDPAAGNAQIELAIVNNPPEAELFGLAPVQPAGRRPSELPVATESPAASNTSLWALDGADELPLGRARRSPDAARSIPLVTGGRPRPSAGVSRAAATPPPASLLATATSAPAGLFQPPATVASAPLASESAGGERQVHLVVRQSLRERVGNYSILVRATDRGQPALSSTKLVNVCVQDVNNHAPVFSQPPLNHTIRVLENATLGTFVAQLEASDRDRGPNGEIHFSLKPTNVQNTSDDWQAFRIDRNTGRLTTAKTFNRQVKKYYTLRVQAQDQGRPTSLASDVDVNIMIVPAGQYQPEFDQQLQQVQFTENLAAGQEWALLAPTTNLDDDPALVQAEGGREAHASWLATPCYFILDSDDHERLFQLDRYSHKLTCKRPLDRERKANYTLLVQATNQCNGPPAYARPLHEPARPAGAEQAAAGVVEYRSSLVEQSGSARARRSSSANGTSSLSAPAAKLVVQAEPALAFNEQAVDALLLTDKTLLKVFVKVRDVNDNAPRFTQRVYTGGITTEADYGTVFMLVQALDPDADAAGQVSYSLVKPVRRSLGAGLRRKRRSAPTTSVAPSDADAQNELSQPTGADQDDLFLVNSQTGEISLNFDPQRHMKGYFEFEVLAKDADGLADSAKVLIYLLRQDQRVKFVLRLAPQELRQRLNRFRSVFQNITGATVNIDSYRYFENHDGTVDKKKTSLYLHFVSADDNTIMEVDKVLTLIDNNLEYLDELYKEFHVLSSEAAHLPLSSGALVDDQLDQMRTGLMGVASFLALILVLVIALCLNQRSRYERQLKAATVSAFAGSPLHLDADYRGQANLPNTNLHSQDPNPIWMNGYSEQDWLANSKAPVPTGADQHNLTGVGIEDADYLSSEHSDLNSTGNAAAAAGRHYNAATTATPRDSLGSSQGRASGSGSASTTNDQQALCRGAQSPEASSLAAGLYAQPNPNASHKKRSQLVEQSQSSHSTFGAYKEVTIYTDHQQFATSNTQQQQQLASKANNLVRTVHQQLPSQVNKIANELNAKHQARAAPNQLFINQHQKRPAAQPPNQQQHRILVHANGTDLAHGIIKTAQVNQQAGRLVRVGTGKNPSAAKHADLQQPQAKHTPAHQEQVGDLAADNFENNLSKLSILNLETTEL